MTINIRLNIITKAFPLLLFGLISSTAYSDCTVAEMVNMAKGGSGKSIIKKTCNSEVADAPRCTFKRALQIALTKKDESDVMEECGSCDNPECFTGSISCPLSKHLPKGSKEGDPCWCPSPMGAISGELMCN